jgi:transposase
MKQIREILRLRFEVGVQSIRKIAQAVGVGKSAVSDYLQEAQRLGITSFEQISELSEGDLGQLFQPTVIVKRSGIGSYEEFEARQKTLPDFKSIHEELRRPGVTLKLLWSEYKAEHPEGYSYWQFGDYYRRFRQKMTLVMRQTHRPGEKAFTDFSGDGFEIINPSTGEITKAELFVAVLGASAYTFACAIESQTLPDWTLCHRKFFEFIKGVTAIVVSDNLKSAVKEPDRYEPIINHTFQQMAEHYRTCIIPARSKKPRDKAKVENGVLQAQRWILAVLRNRKFYSMMELNQAIMECLVKLNSKKMRGYDQSRQELFELIDKPVLKALPAKPYEFSDWKKARLGIDYHLRYDDHFYSAPYQLVKEELWVRASDATIEVYFNGKRVTSHVRSFVKWKETTKSEHMPSHHRAHAKWTPEKIIDWVSSIGPITAQGVQKMIQERDHPEQGYKSALGIISLAKKHGNERVEKASKKAINIESFCYQTLKTMLKNRMEDVHLGDWNAVKDCAQDLSKTGEQLSFWAGKNLRGQGYYH